MDTKKGDQPTMKPTVARQWDYTPPVNKLLTLGDVAGTAVKADYRALGVSEGDIAELIRMATDTRLIELTGSAPDTWAPIHAWRALGQLHALEAIEPVIARFAIIDDTDWASPELIDLFATLGPAVLPAVTGYLADVGHGVWSRAVCAEILGRVGKRYPEARQTCVDSLVRQLEQFAVNEPYVNGMLIGSLIDLKAVETAPVMERAYAAGAVDESMVGDWEEVQVDLGLKAARSTPKPNYLAQKLGMTTEDLDRMRSALRLRGLGHWRNDPWQVEKRKQAKKKRRT